MSTVFPYLASTRVDYTWGGLVDLSMDQMVHAGQHNGIHYSLGYSGHGVQMATYMGKQMALSMLGQAVAEPLGTPAVPRRTRPLRPAVVPSDHRRIRQGRRPIQLTRSPEMSASDQWVVTEELANEPRLVSDPVPDLSVPGGAFIDGVWQRDDLRLPVTDPEDGRLLAYVADSTAGRCRRRGVRRPGVALDRGWPLWARSEASTRRRGCWRRTRPGSPTSSRPRASRPSPRPSARWPAAWRPCACPPRPGRSSTERRSRSQPAGTGGQGRLVHPRARRRGRCAHLVQRPPQPGRAQARAGADRRQRRRPQALGPHAADGPGVRRAPALGRRAGGAGRRGLWRRGRARRW